MNFAISADFGPPNESTGQGMHALARGRGHADGARREVEHIVAVLADAVVPMRWQILARHGTALSRVAGQGMTPVVRVRVSASACEWRVYVRVRVCARLQYVRVCVGVSRCDAHGCDARVAPVAPHERHHVACATSSDIPAYRAE